MLHEWYGLQAREFPGRLPPSIFAGCVAAALAGNPTTEHVALGVGLQAGRTTMAARVTRSKTKRLPSASRKPIRAAQLARQLAEVQALRKLVQKAEAARLN